MTASSSAVRFEKGTTVRTHNTPLSLRAMRTGLWALSRVSADGTAAIAERLFLTPRRRPRPPAEALVLASAKPTKIAMKDGDLAAWEWGPADAPTVLLVHGWEGRGAQLGALVGPLTTSGFRVVTFDAPAHGDSGGKSSSLFQFADSIQRAAETFGPLHAIVTHSMGGASAIWASRSGALAQRLVLIAPPLDLRDFTRTLAGVLGLRDEVISQVHARLHRRFGVPIDEVRSDLVASRLSGPMLVVHDEGDREVPISCGEAVAAAWPGAELVRTHGLGHQRILRDAATLGMIVRFVAQSGPTADAQPTSSPVPSGRA